MTSAIHINVDGLERLLDYSGKIGKQARYAGAVTLTKLAKGIETDLRAEMAGKFVSASPYSLRGTFVQPAKVADLTARVGMKDQKPARGTAPAKLLGEHFAGGKRGNKPMEVAFAAAGILPPGWRVVTGQSMRVDAYGNPSRAVVTEIIGALKTRTGIYKGRGKGAKLVGYFAVKPGDRSRLHPGVWWSSGRAIKPMLIFVSAAAYTQRIDLDRIAEKHLAAHATATYANALAKAMETAR